jgi:serine/threonine protein kinase
MSPTSQSKSLASKSDALLTELIDEVSAKLEAGEPVDLDAFIAAHPERAEALRKVLPALAVLADLGRSAAGGLDDGLTSPRIDADTLGELGDYRIVREIGRGGMGVVYEATQISLNRRVALKVLPFAGALDAHHLARFRLEAQAAAQLHHTNIVPVFAVGAERGVHYYAMQFIEGKTLAELIHELRIAQGLDEPAQTESGEASPTLASRLASGELAPAEPLPSPLAGEGGPKGRMRGAPAPDGAARKPATASVASTPTHTRAFFRTVANLGLQAAEALDYAHRFGILHRDIKPANLLVDIHGNLWVTDFGLARFGDDASLTMTGDLLGTLRYMSPEQALGHPAVVDQRSDVYGLGVTLYEVLTLQPAFDGYGRQEILRRISFEGPRPPRKVDPTVPRDLETIVLKAMSKEPGSRYATAGELADDLRRFSEHKPIRARRPSLWEQALRLGRRHAGVVAAALVVLMIAVGGLLTGIILIGSERDATRAALARAIDQEKIARGNAEEAMAQARRAYENHNWFIQGLTEPLKRMANPDLAKDPEYASMRREVISEAIRAYRGFFATQDQDPEKRFQAADTWIHIALLYTVVDDHVSAQNAYRMAIRIVEDANEKESSAATWSSVGQVHCHLAMELWDVGKRAESEPHFRRATEALRRATEWNPQDPGMLQSSAWFLSLFQDIRFRDPPRALEHARRLVALSSDKENRRFYSFGRRPLFTLGLADYRMGNLDAARKALERSIELREGGDAYEWFVLAMVVGRQGDPERAHRLYRDAVRWMRTYRYSDFELHVLDTEAASVLGMAAKASSTAKEENATRSSKP